MEKNKIISSIKYLVLSIRNWIKNNPWEAFILFLTLTLGAFLRLYKIDQYMTFLGDEGRDAIIVRRFLVLGDPMLIGPGTSIGNMYLGPLYYYLMAPALFLARLSPVGPAVQIAILGIITIFMVWYIAKEWFGKTAAIIASILYAISPIVIIYSRSSWNPNIMPFFSLLAIYSIWNVWKKHQWQWLIVLGISYAFILQSHYLGLLLAPVFAIYWFLTSRKVKNSDLSKYFIRNTIYGLAIFLFLMSPLVIFDARHGWRNFSAIYKFFSERQSTVSIRPWSAIPKTWPISEKIMTRLVTGYDKLAGKISNILLVGSLVLIAFINKKNKKSILPAPYFLLIIWFGFALLGLGLYKQEIYDHYFGFFFTVPFLFIGGVSQFVIDNFKKKGIYILVILGLILVILNIKVNPLKNSPNMQLQRSQQVAQKIMKESNSKPFNLAVVAERNYEDGYQYFLEKDGYPVIDIDAQKLDETITDQLFVVCELPKEKCDPTHSSKAEVANFGWSKIESQWEVMGTAVYKLVHTK